MEKIKRVWAWFMLSEKMWFLTKWMIRFVSWRLETKHKHDLRLLGYIKEWELAEAKGDR